MKPIYVVLVAALFCVTLASGTITTFKTGSFTGSADLGMPCNDTNVGEPESSETLFGSSYTDYNVNMCGVSLYLRKYDEDSYDLTSQFPIMSINTALINEGADKETISRGIRTIDSKPGAVGSGYVAERGTVYEAAFYISPKSYCFITVWGNETKMISVLKTIHIKEIA